MFSALLSGCITYVPAEIEAVPENARVRATLTDEGKQALYRRTGLDRETINGRLVERRGNSVVFSVRSVFASQSEAMSDLVQHIDVPRDDIGRLDLKEVDGPKTTLLIAGSTGVVAATALLAMRSGQASSTPDGNGGGPDESIRFPFLVFRFYLPH
jgi:hypothetical protein